MKKYYLPIVCSVIASFVFVVIYASGATTISTNISTGGTLTVSGNTTISGGTNTFGDANTDVNLFTGTVQASTTALFTAGARMYNTLMLHNGAAAGTAIEGGIYYDTGSSVIKLYDGSHWTTLGTTTSGMSLAGGGDDRVQFADLKKYMTLGTTTQHGLSLVTVHATSSVAIPLTIVASSTQTANLFQVLGTGSAEYFALDKSGNASTTMISTTGNIWVAGSATTTSAGNFTTSGTITALTASTTLTHASTTVSNLGSGTDVKGWFHGTCSLTPGAIAAATTTRMSCSATGVESGDRVFLSVATSSLEADGGFGAEADAWIQMIGASASTTADNIQVVFFNSSSTSLTGTARTWAWMAIR